MTEKEKDEYQEYKTLGGYLKVHNDYYRDCFLESFNRRCDKDQATMLINLPHFNYKIFEDISGITKKMIQEKLK